MIHSSDDPNPRTNQPWKLVSLLWPANIGALLPLALHDLLARLPRILRRLDEADEPGDCHVDSDRSRPCQIRDFRSALPPRLRRAA